MIKLLSDVCEVMIFTASHECYANEVSFSIKLGYQLFGFRKKSKKENF